MALADWKGKGTGAIKYFNWGVEDKMGNKKA
jgi:hypothetical protein